MQDTDPQLEAATQAIGRELLERAAQHEKQRSAHDFWSDKVMSWAESSPQFKTQLFRFIDVFPTLHTPAEIHAHVMEYLGRPELERPRGLTTALKAGGLAKGLLAAGVAAQIRATAGRFIAGADVADALPELRRLWEPGGSGGSGGGVAFSVDLLGEACVSAAEATAYQQHYVETIRTLAAATENWPANAALEADHLGPIPRTNVSVKITALYAATRPIDTEGSIRGLLEALEPIITAARETGTFINFDMEQRAFKDLTLELFERCCAKWDFAAGLALQAYLRSGDEDARRVVDFARRTGRQVIVRLVKGAYWDYETIHARLMDWPAPVWGRKAETDACFERMTRIFLAATPRRPGDAGVKLAIGTHNARSIARALALAQQMGLPENALELQMLRGMAGPLLAAATETGLRVREYVPVGPMIPGMAYLVRRLLENTSNESWLRAGFAEQRPPEDLLASPHAISGEDSGSPGATDKASSGALSVAPEVAQDTDKLRSEQLRLSVAPIVLPSFANEPLRDFARCEVRDAFAAAIRSAVVPMVAVTATVDDARGAVGRAVAALPAWRDTSPADRAAILVHAAALIRGRRDELAGMVIKESGKTWADADADVCEAIDYCEYYARQGLDILPPRRLTNLPGEDNEFWYEPRGVAVVISPWNFPLAICAGMTTAALMTGNAVIVKPAEQTPGIAAVLVDILHQAGVPRDGVQLVAGAGETTGAALVRDPRIAVIAFTGSKAVGLDILAAAAQTAPEQQQVKRVVCEMGGKNAIIVDSSADLDEAVLGVRQSTFGYAGQKCSACSRVIVVESVHDTFLKRLVESTATLVVGDPLDPATDMGPVIDTAAAESIRRYIEIGKTEERLEYAGGVPTGMQAVRGKLMIAPHIFSGIEPRQRLANEEIFGPVLSVMRAADFAQALEWANATSYKLTGGVYSRTPSHLEQAQRQFRVGNLYLNRAVTGALVGRQPFGGLGLSGVGFKAGGPDYLLQFVESRVVCENTLRRGFAPEEDGRR